MSIRYARRGAGPDEVNVSRYGPEPWRRLSPFRVHGGIPGPGRLSRLQLRERPLTELAGDFPEAFAASVEGLWQGLKRIGGATDEALLRGRPKKRRGVPEGHEWQGRLLGYAEAKAVIYAPAWLFVLRHRVADVVEALRRLADRDVAVVDVTYAPDPFAPKPLSHAKLLVDYLDGALEPYLEADTRLDATADALLALYEAESVDAGAVDAWIAAQAEAAAVPLPPLADYAAWARAHERAERMAMVIDVLGSPRELEAGAAALNRWVAAGIVGADEARAMSRYAPFCRFSEAWYAARTG
jgi:hypothetical protein